MKKYLFQSIKIITLCSMLSAGVIFAAGVDFTFTPPAGIQPAYNNPMFISAPVNSGVSNQNKKGALGTGPLFVFGNSEFYGKQSIFSAKNLYVSGRMGVGQGGTGTYVGGWNGPGPAYPGTLVPYDGGVNPTRNLEIVNENNNIPSAPSPYVKSYIKISSFAHTLSFSTPYNGSSQLREVCSNTAGNLSFCPIPALTPIPAACDPSVAPCSFTWNNPGSYSFIVPYNTTSLTIQTWGAGGGGSGGTRSTATLNNTGYGGNGGYGGTYHTQTLSFSPNNTAYNIWPVSTILTVKVGGGGVGSDGEPYNGSGVTPGGAGGPSSVWANGSVIGTVSTGGAGAPAAVYSTNIGGSSGFAGSSGGAGGTGGTDPGCNSAGVQGGGGNGPGGGGGGGAGGRTCLTISAHSGGSGGGGAGGQVTISWQ